MTATEEADHLTSSTASGDHIASESLQEKGNDVVVDNATGQPEYATGFRLAIIMSTVFLSTLLAALDIVSPFPTYP